MKVTDRHRYEAVRLAVVFVGRGLLAAAAAE